MILCMRVSGPLGKQFDLPVVAQAWRIKRPSSHLLLFPNHGRILLRAYMPVQR